MNERERAQDTFRSITKEAVNNILDELDKIGDFARLNAHLVDKADVQEVFKAINSYSKEIEAKYEPKVESRNWRFQFSDEKFKVYYEKEVEQIKPETISTLAKQLEEEKIKEDPKPLKTFLRYTVISPDGEINHVGTQKEISEMIHSDRSNVSKMIHGKKSAKIKGYTIIDNRFGDNRYRSGKAILIYDSPESDPYICKGGIKEASELTGVPIKTIYGGLLRDNGTFYSRNGYRFTYEGVE